MCGGILALAVASGCADDPVESPIDDYGAALKSDFVDNCTDSGPDKPVCVCLYDSLEAEVPYDRFVRLDRTLRDGSTDIPADIEELAVACAADPSADRPEQ
jgi:hypothetical protein